MNIFEFGELSWIEARIFNTLAIGAAPPPLRDDLISRLARIQASEQASRPVLDGLVKGTQSGASYGSFCGTSAVAVDALTGALNLTLGGQRYSDLLRYSYVTYADDETCVPHRLAYCLPKCWIDCVLTFAVQLGPSTERQKVSWG